MGTFRIEEYYTRADGVRETLGSYRIPETAPEKVAALLDVLSAEALRAGGYAKTAVYLDDTPVTVDVDEHNTLRVVRHDRLSTGNIPQPRPTEPPTISNHSISIHEYYVYPDGRRETFSVYHVPAEDRHKAAAILEVANARQLRAGGYGSVAVYLDGKPVDAYVDAQDELQLTPAGGASEPRDNGEPHPSPTPSSRTQ